jgi:phosphomevalonate kinase
MVEAKAPGKVLWLGGYSVLERPNIGYVTAIDAYVHANVNLLEGSNEVHIKAPDFNLEVKGTFDPKTGKISIERTKELNLLITTAEISLSYVISKGFRPNGISIETRNDKAFAYRISGNGSNKKVSKSGMGSSSAVTVALAAAILESYGLDIKGNDALHKISQLSHSVATGKVGSGFDIAAATYGSILYSRYSPSIITEFPQNFAIEDVSSIIDKKWDYTIKSVNLPDIFKTSMANFVNEAAITTSLVGVVNEFKKKNPQIYKDIITEVNDSAEKAVAALSKIRSEDNTNEMEEFVDNFERSRLATRKLGELSGADIEPEDATKLIEGSKKEGALVAKLPGAGGKDSIVAISKGGDDAERLKRFWSSNDRLELLNVSMQNNGVILSKNEQKHTSKSI